MGIIRCELIWSGIEVVITALTRNQVTGNRPWVRIPPAPHNLSGPLGSGGFLLMMMNAPSHSKVKVTVDFVMITGDSLMTSQVPSSR